MDNKENRKFAQQEASSASFGGPDISEKLKQILDEGVLTQLDQEEEKIDSQESRAAAQQEASSVGFGGFQISDKFVKEIFLKLYERLNRFDWYPKWENAACRMLIFNAISFCIWLSWYLLHPVIEWIWPIIKFIADR